MAGLHADEWQRDFTVDLLGEREDGRWAAFQAGIELARQNGKGGIYEIRELAGLFLLGENLLVHTAHEYKTAEQALDRMEALIDGCADLSRKVKSIKRSHGQEGVYLTSGQSLRYATRTSAGLRGWSIDFLGMDEAMHIKDSMHAATFPTLTARPNAQILYAGSAVDQQTMENGLVFARLRERGIAGDDDRLMWVSYGAPFDSPDEVTEEDACNPEYWADANPAFGIRITGEYVDIERKALGLRGFAVERLSVGDWPAIDETKGQGIDPALWAALADARSEPLNPLCFAIDVTPSRGHTSICAAGKRLDGLSHVEVVDHRPGTGWVAQRMAELVKTHSPSAVLLDQAGPAMSLVTQLQDAGVEVRTISTSEHARAFGGFYDAVEQATVRHLGTADLNAAVKGAIKRPLGDAWAWSRKSSTVDISPLVAVTLALFGTQSSRTSAYETDDLLVV
jgi:hypothetical protein